MQERLILVIIQDVNIKCIHPATNLSLKLASSASLVHLGSWADGRSLGGGCSSVNRN